jgi:nucleotide-binding universal stress UspA family protein
VLVLLDGSDLGDAVVPALLPFAEALHWTLLLASALPAQRPSLPFQGAVIPLSSDDTPDPEHILSHLARMAASVRAAGVEAQSTVASGDRVDAIRELAVSADCDLIAMSTHGRSGLARLAIGSLTDALIRTAPIPVVAVHPTKGGQG